MYSEKRKIVIYELQSSVCVCVIVCVNRVRTFLKYKAFSPFPGSSARADDAHSRVVGVQQGLWTVPSNQVFLRYNFSVPEDEPVPTLFNYTICYWIRSVSFSIARAICYT